MKAALLIAAFLAALLLAAAGWGLFSGWREGRAARALAAELAARPAAAGVADPEMLEGLPEIARRYLSRALPAGTPLSLRVELEMEGSFGTPGQERPMRASQVLAPPEGFVWIARMGSGLVRIGGSDGYRAGGPSWTRFRLLNMVPLAMTGGSPDHLRAAAARMALETVWVPAALLPAQGALWRQTGPDSAEVSLPAIPGIEPIQLRIDAEGRVIEAWTMRWSDANPEGVFRLQPFGGRFTAWARFDGVEIPVEAEIGNFWGGPDWAPFFRARITAARFGP